MKKIISLVFSASAIAFSAIVTYNNNSSDNLLISEQIYYNDIITHQSERNQLPHYKNNSTYGVREGSNFSTIALSSLPNVVSNQASPSMEVPSFNISSSRGSYHVKTSEKKNPVSGGIVSISPIVKQTNNKRDEQTTQNTSQGLIAINSANTDKLMKDFLENPNYENQITPPSNLVNTPVEQLSIGSEILLLLFALLFIVKRFVTR